MTPFVRRTLIILATVLTMLAPASVVNAAVTTATKAGVLAGWTQTTAASFSAWNAARLNRAAWVGYGFDWSTDYCSSSPDEPLGFDFRLSCWHHDFGYRNYKAIGQFPANKSRIDDMFYADLKRLCVTYSTVTRPSCYSLAWTYYEAVNVFGSVSAVAPADIDRAARAQQQALPQG
jgi:hypothetical protein